MPHNSVKIRCGLCSHSLLCFVCPILCFAPCWASGAELPLLCSQGNRGAEPHEGLVCGVQAEVFSSVGCKSTVYETYAFPWADKQGSVFRSLLVYDDVDVVRLQRNSTYSVEEGKWQAVDFHFRKNEGHLSWVVDATEGPVEYRLIYKAVSVFRTRGCRLRRNSGKYVTLWNPGIYNKDLYNVNVKYHLPKSAEVMDVAFSTNADDSTQRFEYKMDNSSKTDSCYHSWETSIVSRHLTHSEKKLAVMVFNIDSEYYDRCPQFDSCSEFDEMRLASLILMIVLPIIFTFAMTIWWKGRKHGRMPHMMWIALMILTLLALISSWVGFVQVDRGTDISGIDTLRIRLWVIVVITTMSLSGGLGVLAAWSLCSDFVVTCGGRVEHYALAFSRGRLDMEENLQDDESSPTQIQNHARGPGWAVITLTNEDLGGHEREEGPSSV